MSEQHTVGEAERVMARGVPVTTAQGDTVHLRLDLWGLHLAEQQFGGMRGMQTSLEALKDPAYEGPIVEVLGKFLVCFLADELDLVEVTPEAVREVLRMLDVSRIGVYVAAIEEAVLQAFPPPPPAAKVPQDRRPKKATAGAAARKAPARGRSGSTSPSPSAEQTPARGSA